MRNRAVVVAVLLALAAALWAVWTVWTVMPADEGRTPRGPSSAAVAGGPEPVEPGAGEPAPSTEDDGPAPRERRRVGDDGASGLGGLVLDVDGTPAAGVDVAAYTDRRPEARRVYTQTDDDGRFPVEPFRGHEIIALRARSHCSTWVEVAEDAEEVTLQLGAGAAVQGHVRYADGRPASRAPVHVQYAPETDMSGKYAWAVRTDHDGRYRVAGIPEGWWIRPCVTFAGRHGPVDVPSGPFAFGRRDPALLDRGEAHVAGPEGDLFERELVAQYFPMATVHVELRFPEGAVVPDEVLVETWDADGSGYGAGPCAIDPRAPGISEEIGLGEEQIIRVRANGHVGATDVLRFDEEVERTITVDLHPAARVTARLMRWDGDPAEVADILVSVGYWREHGGSGFGEAVTDARGHADLTEQLPMPDVLDSDDVEVVMSVSGPGVFATDLLGDAPNVRIPGPELARRLRAADAEIVIDVPLVEPKRLTVLVTSEGGRPEADVELHARPDTTFWPARQSTGADGRAVFELLAPVDAGHAWNWAAIRAQPPWGGSFAFPQIGERYRDGGTVSMHVIRLREFSVHVVDESGAAVSGAELSVAGRRYVCDDGGVATVAALPGSTVHLSMAGHAGYSEPLPQDDDSVTITARALRNVCVTVDGPEDALRTSLRCEAVGSGGRWLANVVGPGSGDGPETRLMLPHEKIHITVTSHDLLWEGKADVSADQAEVTVRLARRPLHPVRLRFVENAGGGPSVATRVALRLTQAPHLLDEERVTDVDGEVRLDLPAGRNLNIEYRVEDEPWDSVTLSVPVESPVEVTVVRTGD